MKDKSWGAILFASIVFVIVSIGVLLLQAFIVMLAWNVVIPFLFALPEIGFLRSIAACIIINIVGAAFKYDAPSKE